MSLAQNLARLATILLLVTAVGTAQTNASGPRRHEVAYGGVNLALWEKSALQPKAAIVLIHGATWSSLPDFDLQVPDERLSLMDALVARGYAVFALDLPGYGGSPRLPSGWLSPTEAADAASNALIWVTANHPSLPRKPALFGWSRGSRVAQHVAQRQPALLSEVILFGYPVDPDIRVESAPEPKQPPRTPTTAAAARRDFITPGSISTAAVEAFARAAVAANPTVADWRRQTEWNDLDPQKLSVPVLLIQGEFDPFSPTPAQARFFSRIKHPDRQWIVIPGSDHAAHLENTHAAFVAALVNFLERPRQK